MLDLGFGFFFSKIEGYHPEYEIRANLFGLPLAIIGYVMLIGGVVFSVKKSIRASKSICISLIVFGGILLIPGLIIFFMFFRAAGGWFDALAYLFGVPLMTVGSVLVIMGITFLVNLQKRSK